MNTMNIPTGHPGEESQYCSVRSLLAGESLFGTATRTQVYLLLEYNGAYGAKAIPESNLPQAVKTRLGGLAKEIPHCKALLIRSDRRRTAPGYTFFLARAGENRSKLYAFQLAQHEDFLDLDIEALLADDPQFEAQRLEQQLYLVCTNGRRDKCCAKFGAPVYHALDQQTPQTAIPMVWQCSHLGGHRYAVNLVCLPHGLLYGRVDTDNAAAILAADQGGRIHLPNLRGRTCYEEVAQAAEVLLREQSGENAANAYHMQNVETLGPDNWRVAFRRETPAGAVLHQVELRQSVSEQQVYQSCSLDKQAAVKRYVLLEYTQSSPP